MSLQALIDRRGDVRLPPGTHTLVSPLIVRGHTHVDGWSSTRLATDYDGPAIVIDPTSYQMRWSIRRLELNGGGIQLPPQKTPEKPTFWSAFFTIEDIEITKASVGIEDRGGSWMGKFARVSAFSCRNGFNVRGGTTKRFENCFAGHGTGQGWDIQAAYAVTLDNCAMDHQKPETGAAALFADCRGLKVSSFDFEHNHGTGGALFAFHRCESLSVDGLWSVGNELHVNRNGLYLTLLQNCAGTFLGSLGGGNRPTPDVADGTPTGHTVALMVSGDSPMVLDGSTIAPLRKTQPGQTAFGLVNWKGDATMRGGKVSPHLGPGVRDPHVKEEQPTV